jgi:ornithine cyclodeaminase
MKILGREDVRTALSGLEPEVLASVRAAYVLHGQGESHLPFSSFLRPLGRPSSRIIALPAYLGGPAPVMGLKWISSFPENVAKGMQRAASVVILNDLETGYPVALLEASQISASRTAASAALASGVLRDGRPVRTVGMIGCGTINHRVAAFLTHVHPEIETVVLQDVFPERAEVFAAELAAEYPKIAFRAGDVAEALTGDTVSIATTDSTYWLDLADFPDRPADQLVLHLSLRDLNTSSILSAYNVVDDFDHVCREQTSLHRAEQETGHREFMHVELATLLGGAGALRAKEGTTTVFSPFGLGVLDLAVAEAILRATARSGAGLDVDGFDPGTHKVVSAISGGTA